MSHIATTRARPLNTFCHYYGRDFPVIQFYKCAMSLRIKSLRIARGWTQQDLADKAGLSRSQLAMIEAETRPANTLRLNAIADALGVRPEGLFDVGDDYRAIIDVLKRLSPEDQAVIVRMAEALAAKADQG
jgi:transcriptional regulator with XRE-family HTH domain